MQKLMITAFSLAVLLSAGCTTIKGTVKGICVKATNVVKGAEVQDENDASATAYLAMTPTRLIVRVKVKDDNLQTSNEVAHQNDSVELYFDFREKAKRGKDYYNRGVFQIIAVPETNVVAWNQGPDTELEDVIIRDTKVTSVLTDDGYIVTFDFPLVNFEENHVIPSKDFNFVVGLNDYDEGEDAVQIMSSGTEDNWQDPSAFSCITLP